LGLPDIFKVTGTPTEGPTRLGCVRQIIFKMTWRNSAIRSPSGAEAGNPELFKKPDNRFSGL